MNVNTIQCFRGEMRGMRYETQRWRTLTEPCARRQTSPRWCAHVCDWRLQPENDMVVKDTKRGRQPVSRPTLTNRTV